MSNITLDTTLMMEVNIGDGGLSDTDLANLSPKLKEALNSVQTAVASGELGFWKLPSEPTHLEQVRERVAALTFDPKSVFLTRNYKQMLNNLRKSNNLKRVSHSCDGTCLRRVTAFKNDLLKKQMSNK